MRGHPVRGGAGTRVRAGSSHGGRWRLVGAAGAAGLLWGRHLSKARLGQEREGSVSPRSRDQPLGCLSPGCCGAGAGLTPPPLGDHRSAGDEEEGTVHRAPHRDVPFSPQSTGRPCPEPDFSGGPGCAYPWAGVSKETWAALCSAEPPPQLGPGRREPRPPGKCAPRAGEGGIPAAVLQPGCAGERARTNPRVCSHRADLQPAARCPGGGVAGRPVVLPALQKQAGKGSTISVASVSPREVPELCIMYRTFSVGLWHIFLLLARIWETVEYHFS